jgi:homoserine O-acetyltransferase
MTRFLIGLSLATQLILGVHEATRAESPESVKFTGFMHGPNGRASDLIPGVAGSPARRGDIISGGYDARDRTSPNTRGVAGGPGATLAQKADGDTARAAQGPDARAGKTPADRRKLPKLVQRRGSPLVHVVQESERPGVADEPALDPKVFNLGAFRLENGKTLPDAKLVYATLGKLNADKSNAILLPSHYSADHKGYNYLIGADKVLNPEKYFLILTNMFANGVSSSPSNTPAPFSGPDFPEISIRDNVNATHELVTKHFGIDKLVAVIGFSMGGQQAYQWAVSYPEGVPAIVVICGNAKQYPFGIIRLQGSITALKADSVWNNGHYTMPPEKGLRAMSMHYMAWVRSAAAWDRDLFKGFTPEEVELFLRDLEGLFECKDANDLLSQAETWKRHDIGDTPGFGDELEKALGAIKAKVLLMPSTTDQYFPLADNKYESQFIPNVKFVPIETIFGHTGGGGSDEEATKFISRTIDEFLR